MANENHHDTAPSSSMPLQLLDKKQLAKRIGVSVRTIENLVKAGFRLASRSLVLSHSTYDRKNDPAFARRAVFSIHFFIL